MSAYRQNSVTSDLDKKAEDMDDIASTPPFSMTSATSEGLADLYELMHRDDVLEDQEVTWLRTHSSLSDESTWCSSPDSDISDRVTPFDQNVDEEIKKVCQNFFNLENLETEADDFGEDEDVRTTDTGSTSSLGIRCSGSALGATLLSRNSATSEDLVDLDELMHRDDVLEDQEVTLLRTHSSLSDESRMTYPSSWCSSPDSDISDRITPFDQNVDEEIKKVCQSLFNLENLETEADDFGEDEDVRTTDTGSTSSHGIRCSGSALGATLLSRNSATSEDLVDLDELMHREDVLEDQEVTLLRTHSSLSDESRMTYPSSWCSSPDSDISDRITPFDQNVDEEIKKVCQSLFNLENLETEADDFGEDEDVRTTDTGSTSSLAIRSNECTVTAPLKHLNDLSPGSQQGSLCSEEMPSTSCSAAPRAALLSMNSATSEDLVDLDELMHRNDVLEDQEVTWLRTHSSLSDESRMTYPSSWCSSPDSDISDRVTPFDQNVDEEIKKVCQNLFNLENLETEADDFGEDEDVRTTDTGSTSSLAIRSNESTVPASCPSSSVKTQQSTEPAVKRIQTGGHKGKRKKSQWKWCFRGRQRNKIQPAPLEHLDGTVRSAGTNKTLTRTGENTQCALCSQEMPSTTSCIAALGVALRSTELMLVDYVEDEDQTTEDTRKVLSPLSIASSITPDEFQDEMSSSLSQQSTDSDEEDEESFSQSSVEKSQSDSECLSNNQNDAEETKAKRRNHFSRFFCKIFSKNNQEEKEKKVSAEKPTKQPPFWMWLLFCGACSCCLDK